VTLYGQCWIYDGYLKPDGYGLVSVDGKTTLVHRAVYEVLVGPIINQIDHVKARGCTSRACYNPTHLEDVTQAENVRRGANATKTHCKQGHEFTPANTHTRKGKKPQRVCRECHRNVVANSRG
jgi:hypothetical protein